MKNLMTAAKDARNAMNDAYYMLETLMPSVLFCLHDYRRKLECDDTDPNAVEKMATVADVIARIQGGV